MIYIYMRGRLGNQLFQYAFARTLQINNPNQKVIYVFDDIYNMGKAEDGWENSLKYFNTVGVYERKNESLNLSFSQKALLKIYWKFFPIDSSVEEVNKYQKKWLWILNKASLYYLDVGYYSFSKKIKKSDCIISGHFESEKYFSEIADKLKKEISPIYPLIESNKELMKQISVTNSVCISIRRGDFISNPDNEILNVCTEEYFRNAVYKIKQTVNDAVFFVFSDDIAWAKEADLFNGEKCFYESGSDPVWEKLRLMYSCKHFIISNSTFSWWAQYLSKNKNKVVIAPKKWFNSECVPDIFQDNWTLL